jgi:2-polyprenyl-6-hydroxyphenyl methylase/3-demethylubiquinone-9 3-methyltransferase
MTNTLDESAIYGHGEHAPESDGYLLPVLVDVLRQQAPSAKRLFDLGAGNGGSASSLSELGFDVIGVEPSPEGVAYARARIPAAKIEIGSGYDDLAAKYGVFPVVYSLEVIEHVYNPRLLVKSAFDLLEPGGLLIMSTPYHGYWKNLLIAITGGFDKHFTALWDHGHIKFWSPKTLRILLEEAGFSVLGVRYAGRFRPISKSMFILARRP